jgi:hypothetical protein
METFTHVIIKWEHVRAKSKFAHVREHEKTENKRATSKKEETNKKSDLPSSSSSADNSDFPSFVDWLRTRR